MSGTRRRGRDQRLALVLVPPGARVGAPPPGIEAAAWSRSLIEDSYEVVAGLEETRHGLAATASDLSALGDLTWPDAELVPYDVPVTAAAAAVTSADASVTSAAIVRAVVDAVWYEADYLVLLSPDAPDLPALHVGKLFQALERADIAWVPVADGGVAALGVALPPSWVWSLQPGLDSDPRQWLAAAPQPALAVAVPGWHRLRAPGDVRHLDPGLSGWESTRALLSGRPLT